MRNRAAKRASKVKSSKHQVQHPVNVIRKLLYQFSYEEAFLLESVEDAVIFRPKQKKSSSGLWIMAIFV